MLPSPIRVFLVDDSPLALALLKRMLATSPQIEMVGTARNGREALAAFALARPDVICTDLVMPVMDGLELIREAMVAFPRPILVISGALSPEERHKTYELLQAGAVDVLAKPGATDDFEESARLLVQKIRILSGVFVARRRPEPGAAHAHAAHAHAAHAQVLGAPPEAAFVVAAVPAGAAGSLSAAFRWAGPSPPRVVAIGSSTGGPQVLATILSALPADFPSPILCVQHISKGFLEGLVEWLDGQCRLSVQIARPGERALAGHAYFPAEDTHLEINGAGCLVASPAPPVDGHRPSATAMFNSVARHYGGSAVAILLTGMGADGASGLRAIFEAGGVTVAQDEASCVVFGMPKVAIEMGAARFAMAPPEIGLALARLATHSPKPAPLKPRRSV